MEAIENMFSDEEKAYFTSHGKKEDGLEDERQDEPTRQDVQTSDDEPANEEPSDGVDETHDAGDGESEDSNAQSTTRETIDDKPKQSKRDFEKQFKTEYVKHKELKEKHAELLRNSEALQKKLEALLAREQQKIEETKAQNIPDPEIDPLGYHQYKLNALENDVAAQKKYILEQAQYAQQEQQFKSVVDSYAKAASDFAQHQPDFKEAYKYLVESRIKEHLAAGFSEQEASQLLTQEELSIIERSYQQGVNPAERVYGLAKARGYTANQQTKQPAKPQARLADIEKGLQNAKSLQPGGVPPTSDELNIENIDEMNFAEFDRFWATLKKRKSML